MSDATSFPRSFLKSYPKATRAEGCFIYTAEGRRYLDACGGAAVVTIGHGVAEVARAIGDQASRLAYLMAAAAAIQFHPPGRVATADGLDRWLAGEALRIE